MKYTTTCLLCKLLEYCQDVPTTRRLILWNSLTHTWYLYKLPNHNLCLMKIDVKIPISLWHVAIPLFFRLRTTYKPTTIWNGLDLWHLNKVQLHIDNAWRPDTKMRIYLWYNNDTNHCFHIVTHLMTPQDHTLGLSH